MNDFFKKTIYIPVWILEGIAVGLGGILPGISGGTLCAAFGMYRPMTECISGPISGIRRHGRKLFWFLCGGLIGFVGLAGVGAGLLNAYPKATAWSFIGMLVGTFPSLWKDAGKEGRGKTGLIALTVGFLCMTVILWTSKSVDTLKMESTAFGFALCGVLWGMSLLVPGLSASSLIMFFGLYAPMLEGIGKGDFAVLIPLAGGCMFCVLLLGKLVERGFQKHFQALSHGVLGAVGATALGLIPGQLSIEILWGILGFAVSYLLTVWGDEKAGKAI